MNFLQILKIFFSKLTADEFGATVEKQKEFLSQLPVPLNDIERSYFQYRCQAWLMKSSLRFLANTAAIPLLLLYPMKYRQKNMTCPFCRKEEAVLIYASKPDILQDSLQKEFKIVQEEHFQRHLRLTKEDFNYLRALRRKYPLAFYFRFKCMIKIAMYSYLLKQYNPKAIICSEEYSFTSSLLTDYCEKHGVEHINIMHGEKLYYIRDSFVRFHRFYVWDEHYARLFTEMRAAQEQFRVEIPPALKIAPAMPEEKVLNATYYLGGEAPEQIKKIVTSMKRLQQRGRVAIRPHPRYTDLRVLQRLASGLEIEDGQELPFSLSIRRTKMAIALNSTALLQASCCGTEVVIDDVTDASRYLQLQKMRYIMAIKPHCKLSEYLNSIE